MIKHHRDEPSPETDTDLLALAETLEQWVEAIRAPNDAELTLVDMAYLNGECVSDSIELAVKALRRHAQRAPNCDLLQRLRDYLMVNMRPGNDLAPKYIKEIDAALSSTEREPLVFSGERDPFNSIVDWAKEQTETVTSTVQTPVENNECGAS